MWFLFQVYLEYLKVCFGKVVHTFVNIERAKTAWIKVNVDQYFGMRAQAINTFYTNNDKKKCKRIKCKQQGMGDFGLLFSVCPVL